MLNAMSGGSGLVRSEGHSIALQMVKHQKDSSTLTFGLDFSNAPIPPRKYSAELATVQFDGHDVRMIFGQSGIFGNELDTALLVRLSTLAMRGFMNSIDNLPSPSLEEIAAIIGFEPEPLSEINSQPRQIANVIANFVSVAISGNETCLDFYHASPFAMRKAVTGKMLEVEAVVRVDLRTSQFMSIIAESKAIIDKLPVPGKKG